MDKKTHVETLTIRVELPRPAGESVGGKRKKGTERRGNEIWRQALAQPSHLRLPKQGAGEAKQLPLALAEVGAALRNL